LFDQKPVSGPPEYFPISDDRGAISPIVVVAPDKAYTGDRQTPPVADELPAPRIFEFMEGLLHQAGEMTILISFHELHEIEGVASHLGFLDEGRLLFVEPMDELNRRFREVHVTFESNWLADNAKPEYAQGDWRRIGPRLDLAQVDRLGTRSLLLNLHIACGRALDGQAVSGR
jgi:hypothetical protein